MLKSMTITAVPAVRRRNAALIAAESGVPVLDVVVPVFNEQAVLADSIHRLHRHLLEDFPFSFRITIADNASTDDTPRIAGALAGELPEVRVVRLGGQGAGTGTAHGVVSLRRHGSGLHGRRPVDRPGRIGATGRAAGLRTFRPRHRHQARRAVPGGARDQAGDHLALLQPAPALDFGGAVQRCAVRVQGDPRRRRRPNCCRCRGHRLVLRHRAAGAGRAQRLAHP